MARLSEIEKYYIDSHRETMTAKEISEKMRKAVTTEDVKEYVEHLQSNDTPNAADSMGRQVGVVVMTETASTIGDEHGEEVRGQQTSLDTSTIHRIKEDK